MEDKQKTIKPEKPGGFLDFLPAEYIARDKIIKTAKKVFSSFGFDPVETPKIEFYKTLSGEKSDTGKQIFQIRSEKENEPLALIFDHTVPLARIVAENPYNTKTDKGIELPWKRMAFGPVFRGESPQSGRYCQLYQIDADIVGSSSDLADTELIALIYKTFSKLKIENFVIKINNRKILNGLADIADIKDRESVTKENITKEILRILDKINKIGTEEVLKKLQEKPKKENPLAPGLSEQTIKEVKKYLSLKGDNHQLLDECGKIFKNSGIAQEGIKELTKIIKLLKSFNVPEEFVKIDFSIARGLDYYTGPVMETFLLDAPEFGSVASGGRYNNLLTRFTGKELPATGVSIGIDRLFAALKKLELINTKKNTLTDVMVLRLLKNRDEEYLKIADTIRKKGYNCEISLLKDTTFKNQFNFAIRKGIKYIIICGEEEFKKGTVQIKNTKTREQKEIKQEEIGNFFEK